MELKCRSLGSKFYSHRSHLLLNYLTLHIGDPIIAQQVQTHELENLKRLSLPLLVISIFLLLWQLVETLGLHSGNCVELILSVTPLLSMLLLYILRKKTT